MPSTLYPLSVVAERTGRSYELLRRWVVDGTIPGVRVGRDWYIRESDLYLIERMPRRKRQA